MHARNWKMPKTVRKMEETWHKRCYKRQENPTKSLRNSMEKHNNNKTGKMIKIRCEKGKTHRKQTVNNVAEVKYGHSVLNKFFESKKSRRCRANFRANENCSRIVLLTVVNYMPLQKWRLPLIAHINKQGEKIRPFHECMTIEAQIELYRCTRLGCETARAGGMEKTQPRRRCHIGVIAYSYIGNFII